jgi:hypothetical protein
VVVDALAVPVEEDDVALPGGGLILTEPLAVAVLEEEQNLLVRDGPGVGPRPVAAPLVVVVELAPLIVD